MSAGVQFPPRSHAISGSHATPILNNNSPGVETSPSKNERPSAEAEHRTIPETSIIQKASSALEVLREVLDAVDAQRPEGARDEFTLDLVEQCSFQKQRVMHLAVTSRDENVVSRAIELNEQLQEVLGRHDVLIAGRSVSTSNYVVQEVEEEEEAEQLFHRIRKGKACAQPEAEDHQVDRGEMWLQHPCSLIRPLKVESCQQPSTGADTGSAIPPPPAKHIEREKFFQEKRVTGHVRSLSLHGEGCNDGGGSSRSSSHSRCGSLGSY
ncbi:hypothetical protein NMG60_11006961 [Bertholletia excelsa]